MRRLRTFRTRIGPRSRGNAKGTPGNVREP